MDLAQLIQSSLILFAIVNPIGSIPIFLQLTQSMSPKAKQKAFATGVFTSFVILSVFVLFGQGILTNFFGIQMADLMIAGGLLLLIIAIDHLVFGALVRGVLGGKKEDPHYIGAVPIACPILAGPGAMMTVLLTFSEHGLAVAVGSIVVVSLISWLILRFIDTIYRALGEVVCLVLSKILCLFIAAIGVHLLLQGLGSYFK